MKSFIFVAILIIGLAACSKESKEYAITDVDEIKSAIIYVNSDSCICISRYFEQKELELLKQSLKLEHTTLEIDKIDHAFRIEMEMKNGQRNQLLVDNSDGQIIQYYNGNYSIFLKSETNFGTWFTEMTNIEEYDCSTNQISINFKEITLEEYIEILQIENPIPHGFYLINSLNHVHENWLNLNNIEPLIELMYSSDKSYCIQQFISSNAANPLDSSTLGGQIMNIIDSYRFNQSYPYFLTECTKNDSVRQQEIFDWWNEINE